jgi:hypothetical protein
MYLGSAGEKQGPCCTPKPLKNLPRRPTERTTFLATQQLFKRCDPRNMYIGAILACHPTFTSRLLVVPFYESYEYKTHKNSPNFEVNRQLSIMHATDNGFGQKICQGKPLLLVLSGNPSICSIERSRKDRNDE